MVPDGKDLGCHMNASDKRLLGTTLSNRLQKVAEEVGVLNKIKASYERKAMVLRSAKIPKALYGCEAAPANERLLQVLRTKFTQALSYTTKQRSSDLTFATCSQGPDLDPDVHILVRRAVALRRYITRSGEGDGRTKVDVGSSPPDHQDARVSGPGSSPPAAPSNQPLPPAWKEAAGEIRDLRQLFIMDTRREESRASTKKMTRASRSRTEETRHPKRDPLCGSGASLWGQLASC